MNRYPLWKYCLIAMISIIGVLYALPNAYGEDPAVQISAHSGVAIDKRALDKVDSALSAAKLIPFKVEHEGDKSALLRFDSVEKQLAAQDALTPLLGDDYTVALNLAPATPGWLTAIGAKPMKLGLDLRGGVHFLLAIDVATLLDKRVNGDVRNVRDELRTAKIRGAAVSRSKDDTIVVQFRSKDDYKAGMTQLRQGRFQDYKVLQKLETDSNRLKLVMTPLAIQNAQNNAIEQTTNILRNRINELGVSEPIVQRQGVDRISVDLPGVQDTARAKQILGGTASIELRLVDVEHDPDLAAESKKIPATTQLYQYENRAVLLEKRVVLSGTSITGAVSSMDQYGQPAVKVRLGGGNESSFYRITKQNIGRPMAMVFIETKLTPKQENGEMKFVHEKKERIISIATIRSALPNNFEVSGLHDTQESMNLALLLRSGALPAPITIVEESTVGPSMGKDNIAKGVLSVEIGFVFIILFMLVYYRFFGFAANAALLMNLVFLVAVMSLIGATLTLPGIAGILLTLGMAVDANVLIFERIREELRNGMTPQSSISAGFDRAFSTIIDANVTTLIAAVALFALGSGAVKGFAVTLSIGLLTSMFTAIMGTRAIINLAYGNRQVKDLSIGISTSKAS